MILFFFFSLSLSPSFPLSLSLSLYPAFFPPVFRRACTRFQVRTFEPIQERSRVLRPVNPLSVSPLLPLNPWSVDNRVRRSKAKYLLVQLCHFSLRGGCRCAPFFMRISREQFNRPAMVWNKYSLTRDATTGYQCKSTQCVKMKFSLSAFRRRNRLIIESREHEGNSWKFSATLHD